MHSLLAISLLSAVSLASAAPTPQLDAANPPRICAVSSSDDEWLPTQADIRNLEKAMPAYFRALKLHPSELPEQRHRYARHYRGIVKDGKRYVYGSFYPASEPMAARINKGCLNTLDGGNSYWDLFFDPKTGEIEHIRVNGIA